MSHETLASQTPALPSTPLSTPTREAPEGSLKTTFHTSAFQINWEHTTARVRPGSGSRAITPPLPKDALKGGFLGQEKVSQHDPYFSIRLNTESQQGVFLGKGRHRSAKLPERDLRIPKHIPAMCDFTTNLTLPEVESPHRMHGIISMDLVFDESKLSETNSSATALQLAQVFAKEKDSQSEESLPLALQTIQSFTERAVHYALLHLGHEEEVNATNIAKRFLRKAHSFLRSKDLNTELTEKGLPYKVLEKKDVDTVEILPSEFGLGFVTAGGIEIGLSRPPESRRRSRRFFSS